MPSHLHTTWQIVTSFYSFSTSLFPMCRIIVNSNFKNDCADAYSSQPWICHPLHTKLSVVYILAVFSANDNNYGQKHFTSDEVVRASIWNI